MVEFRPHKLSVLTPSGHRDDETGDWIVEGKSWSEPIPCRYEPNGTGQQIQLEDGEIYTFSYVVYLDLDDREFSKGDTVRLYDKAGQLIAEQRIARPHKGQLNTRLWL